MNPTLNIGALAGSEVGAELPFDLQLPQPKLADLTELHDLVLHGRVTVLEEGLLIAGTATGLLPLECGRCLKPYHQELAVEFSEEFAEHPQEEQFGFSGDTLNLTEMLRTVLLLAVPDKPVHDPACRGLCPVCGRDLNEEPHQHPAEPGDNPFSALKQLKE